MANRSNYSPQGERRSCLREWLSYFILSLIFALALISTLWSSKAPPVTRILPSTCENPSIRKEWRTLQTSEQVHFISSVQCLMEIPSLLRPDGNNMSRYDDFVHTHAVVGGKTHNTASFLPWHRMFINEYHIALRKDCGYTGVMPYWDWEIDSANLSNSPIWDKDHGFGGNGIWDDEQGHQCVRDGPFANTIRSWIVSNATGKIQHKPHCMSRIFRERSTEAAVYDWLHDLVSPEKVEQALQKDDYEQFFLWFQRRTHNAIPFFIRGEWASFQVPNGKFFFNLSVPSNGWDSIWLTFAKQFLDPVFFLHHAQVDRLWSIWQDRDIVRRATDYSGPRLDSSSGAKPSDILEMGQLVSDGRVSDYLDTRNNILCYKYQS